VVSDNKHGYEPILMSIDIEPHDDLAGSQNIRKTAAITNDLGNSGQNRLTLGDPTEDLERPIGEAMFRGSQPMTNLDSVMTANFDKFNRNTMNPPRSDEDIE
jgi:hypothetical protein